MQTSDKSRGRLIAGFGMIVGSRTYLGLPSVTGVDLSPLMHARITYISTTWTNYIDKSQYPSIPLTASKII